MEASGHLEFVKPEGRYNVDFCEPQLNLLAHAQAIELEIGSRCGGHGICGGDRVRIDLPVEERSRRLSRITEDEREHLSDEELQEGWRLACQCFPQPGTLSLTIEAPLNSRS
jgi:ferredoxin